jgi:hypothetical protein
MKITYGVISPEISPNGEISHYADIPRKDRAKNRATWRNYYSL